MLGYVLWIFAGLMIIIYGFMRILTIAIQAIISLLYSTGIIKPKLVRRRRFSRASYNKEREDALRAYIANPSNTDKIFSEMQMRFGHLPLFGCKARSQYYLTPEDCRFILTPVKPALIAGYIKTNRRYALDYLLSKEQCISEEGYKRGYFSMDQTTTTEDEINAAEYYMSVLSHNLGGRRFVKSIYSSGEIRFAWQRSPADIDFVRALEASDNGRDSSVIPQ